MSYLRLRSVRAAVVACGVLGALFAPPYVPLAAMLVLALCSSGYETIFIGVLLDLLWFSPGVVEGLLGFSGSPYSLPLFTLAGFMLAWGLEPLRREFLV